MGAPTDYTKYFTKLDFSPLADIAHDRDIRRAREATIDIQRQKFLREEQDATRKAQDDQAWAAAVKTAMTSPSTENFNALYAFPDKVSEASKMHGEYTEGQQRRNLTAATEVGGLINAGAYSQALAALEKRRAALVEAGESAEITDGLVGALKDGSPAAINQARGLAGIYITMASGDPEKAGPLLDRLGYSRPSDFDVRKQDEIERHNRVSEGQGASRVEQGAARVGLSAAAGARAAAKAAGGSKGGGGGGYEYRIGPDGKLQRRKR